MNENYPGTIRQGKPAELHVPFNRMDKPGITKSTIQSELDRSFQLLDNLRTAIYKLGEVLTPVMDSADTNSVDVKCQDRPEVSEIITKIHYHCADIEALKQQVTDIHSRLLL